jgi:hypothetical protein
VKILLLHLIGTERDERQQHPEAGNSVVAAAKRKEPKWLSSLATPDSLQGQRLAGIQVRQGSPPTHFLKFFYAFTIFIMNCKININKKM